MDLSERAVVKRANRKLLPDMQLKVGRPHLQLGRYYLCNVHLNRVVRSRLNLDRFARWLGAIGPYEYAPDRVGMKLVDVQPSTVEGPLPTDNIWRMFWPLAGVLMACQTTIKRQARR